MFFRTFLLLSNRFRPLHIDFIHTEELSQIVENFVFLTNPFKWGFFIYL